MEEDAQKMVALKKAYADIILNTAKEAAARIMVSELKATRFQQDLCSAKDEAIRMLVRLKQMMDSKINETEITSLSRLRRIEELEEQLHEAEQIIIDLRTDLKQVQNELEKVKNNRVRPLNGQISKEDMFSHENTIHKDKLNTSEPIIFCPSDSGPKIVTMTVTENTPLNQITLENRCCDATTKQTELSSDSHLENNYPDNPDTASIIMRSKKPVHYRKGCTHRIRAFGRNLWDGKLPPRHDDQLSNVKNESVIKVDEMDEKDEGTCTVPSPKAESMDIMKKPTGLEEVRQLNSSAYENQPVKVIRRRKRKIRYGNAKKISRKSRPHQLMKPSQPSLLSHCKTYSNSTNDNVKPAGACTVPSPKVDNMDILNSTGLEEKLQQNRNGYKDQVVKVIPRGYRKIKMRHRDTISASFKSSTSQFNKSYPPSSGLFHCKTYSCSFNGNVKSGEDMLETTEDEAKTELFLHLDPTVNSPGVVQNATDNDAELIGKSVLVKQECDTAESSRVRSCGLNLEIVDEPLMNPDPEDAKASEANNGAPSQLDNNRLLKYTFCRKRKKESLSNPDENTSLEKGIIKRRAGEKQSGAPEPEKSSLINESSRDSRRLVQVARQLISLSGKRWW